MIKIPRLSTTIPGNLFLLTLGAMIYVIGYNMIAAPHEFVPSGAYGITVLLKRFLPALPLSAIYLLVNVPLFAMAFKGVSFRFLLYNLYSTILFAIFIALVNKTIVIDNTILAAVAAGAVMGVGSGMILRSVGGGGGIDVLTVIANVRYGIRMGTFIMSINTAIMLFAATQVTADTLIASVIMIFVSSVITENTLSMFNRRKQVKIITSKEEEMGRKLLEANISGTILRGHGLYSKSDFSVIMVITNNYNLKKLENIVFDVDSKAIFIAENTFSVIGETISPRKKY